MTDAWGGPRSQARPPDKGVFPLDHFNECQAHKREYMACLRRNNNVAKECADVSRSYLQCRMERCARSLLAVEQVMDFSG